MDVNLILFNLTCIFYTPGKWKLKIIVQIYHLTLSDATRFQSHTQLFLFNVLLQVLVQEFVYCFNFENIAHKNH